MTDALLQRPPLRKLKRMRSIRVLLMPVYFERLVWAARARGMTADRLAHILLEHVLRDDLIKAILDDHQSHADPASSSASAGAAV